MAILKIPVTKAGNRAIDIDTDVDLNDEMFRLALEEGLKVLMNKRMSKVPAQKGLEGKALTDAQDSAYAIAQENYESLKAGKLRKGRAATTTADGKKVSGVILTEARRLAKEVVKNEIKNAGMKVSHVAASDITKAANALIEADPSFIEQATANIEARSHVKAKLDIAALVHESPKLVAAAEKAKAERKTQLSVKQAGKAAPRKTAQPTA